MSVVEAAVSVPRNVESPEEASIRFRRSSGRRYRKYRQTAKELDRATRDNKIDDDELADRVKTARDSGNRDGVVISRRRSGKRSRSFGTLFREFLKLIAGGKGVLVASLIVTALATIFGLVSPYAIKVVGDHVIDDKPMTGILAALPLPSEPRPLLWTVFALLIATALISLVLNLWSRWQATKVAKRTVVHSRKVAFEKAVRLPLNRVYDIKSGGVASILRDDAGGVGELVFSMLYNPWKAVVQILGTVLILAWMEWRLMFLFVVVVPIIWFTHRTWISRIRPLWRDTRTTRQMVDGHATESFGGMRVVRTFGRHRGESAQFVANNNLMARQELYTWWWMRGIDAAWQVIIPAAVALLLLGGGYIGLQTNEAGDPMMTGPELAAFVAYLFALLQPIATLAASATGFQNQLAGLDRTLDLLEEPGEFGKTDADTVPLDRQSTRGHIEINGLTYAYPLQSGDLGDDAPDLGEPVLNGVTLDVPAGTTVALVGPSGAGKTTLCNLIARFFDPTGGQILLDGRDLREYDVDDYRSLLGIVEQDTFLFDGTIAQNIAFGKRDATNADVREAARLANADGFIEKLEGGYDALIGERGVKLSGGQRQRITIARAILADPKILILDEATSNLDAESERLIQASLAKLTEGRTCFVIAHRLSTIRNADVIAVLVDGELAELGSHDELLQRSGRYQRMVELQTEPTAQVSYE